MHAGVSSCGLAPRAFPQSDATCANSRVESGLPLARPPSRCPRRAADRLPRLRAYGHWRKTRLAFRHEHHSSLRLMKTTTRVDWTCATRSSSIASGLTSPDNNFCLRFSTRFPEWLCCTSRELQRFSGVYFLIICLFRLFKKKMNLCLRSGMRAGGTRSKYLCHISFRHPATRHYLAPRR